MATKRLGIEQITTDGGTQAREHLSEDAIAEYAAIYKESPDTLPPLRVAHDATAGTYWLIDGFHRHAGAVRAKMAKVPCEVVPGNLRFAILEACGANDSHGVRRTNEDKRRAVRMLLSDNDWAMKSDRWIAEHAKVSPSFVGSVRQSVQLSTNTVEQAREGKDGRQRPTPSSAPEQRAAVAEAVAAKPDATVREIAEETGASVGTVQAVKSDPKPSKLVTAAKPFSVTHGAKWRQAFGTLAKMIDAANEDGRISTRHHGRLVQLHRQLWDTWEDATGEDWTR